MKLYGTRKRIQYSNRLIDFRYKRTNTQRGKKSKKTVILSSLTLINIFITFAQCHQGTDIYFLQFYEMQSLR